MYDLTKFVTLIIWGITAVIEYFNSLDYIMKFYYGIALVGGVIFFIQLILLFIGIGGDSLQTDIPDPSAYTFKFFSIQGITSFFLMFGIIGAYTYDETSNALISFIAALIAGTVMNLIICKLMKTLLKLQSSGNLDYKNAVNVHGTVYANIPANGVGQIQITIQDRMVFPKAVSANKEEIKTGERIKVVDLEGENVLVVEKL